tara:strand:- start:43 stop:252 length:210 start_codon:yes stop_codon:yes gene_type:complete
MKLSKEDYVILKDGVPISPLDVILHYTSIVEMFNDGQRLYEGEEIVRMTELPQELQDEYIKTIIEMKEQ